jgi:hypothetical protein
MKTLVKPQGVKTEVLSNPLTVKEEICQFLEMSESEYSQLQFERAYGYLTEYLPSIDDTSRDTKQWWVEALTQSTVFWGWWVKQWEKRDCMFLNQKPQAGNNGFYSRMKYMELHSIEELLTSTKMYGRITNAAYEEMVHRVIKEEVKRG